MNNTQVQPEAKGTADISTDSATQCSQPQCIENTHSHPNGHIVAHNWVAVYDNPDDYVSSYEYCTRCNTIRRHDIVHGTEVQYIVREDDF